MSEPALKFEPTFTAPQQRRVFYNLLPLIIVLSSAVLISGLSYYWFVYLHRYVITDDAYVEADFYPVSTKVAGAVKEVYAREGQSVKKGDILLLIDDNDLTFEKNFKQIKVEKATLDYKRATTLHASKAISDFDFENAEASLKAAVLDLQGSEIKIKYTKILATSDGIVAKRSVQPGQIIQPGQSLFIIVDDNDRWVKANFKETQINQLRLGQAVEVKVDGYTKQLLHGTIESIFPSSGAKLSILPPENSTGNFTRVVQRISVKIALEKNQKQKSFLKPGMSVEVSVDSDLGPQEKPNNEL